ncbi:MAG: 4'-phosphopantetheinyl transferase superfamily protein, partial [Gemmatimonadota bacterium]
TVAVLRLSTTGPVSPDQVDVLSPDERARADRFRLPEDHRRFVTVRHALRLVLGGHLGEAPDSIRFRYGPQGKPALEAPGAADAVRFNVSHAGDRALIAVARGREVGVDIERVRLEPVDALDLAERFFSSREAEALASLPPAQVASAFHAGWTRKEAFMKAVGKGLALPLDAFDVSLTPGEPARLLATRWDPAEAERWSLKALDVGPGYAAALAVEGHDWSLREDRWPD